MKHIVLSLLRGYKKALSPLLGQHCRFFPSCSDYTREAIVKYGLAKGLYLGTKRLLKCHPLHPGGVDPVP
jgi:putative membrane protein insertion efficiency factor